MQCFSTQDGGAKGSLHSFSYLYSNLLFHFLFCHMKVQRSVRARIYFWQILRKPRHSSLYTGGVEGKY